MNPLILFLLLPFTISGQIRMGYHVQEIRDELGDSFIVHKDTMTYLHTITPAADTYHFLTKDSICYGGILFPFTLMGMERYRDWFTDNLIMQDPMNWTGLMGGRVVHINLVITGDEFYFLYK